jgi:hypothetical protein
MYMLGLYLTIGCLKYVIQIGSENCLDFLVVLRQTLATPPRGQALHNTRFMRNIYHYKATEDEDVATTSNILSQKRKKMHIRTKQTVKCEFNTQFNFNYFWRTYCDSDFIGF